MTDLKMCIHTIQKKGDMVLLCMDLNDPVQRHDHKTYFEELNMKEIMLSTHSGKIILVTNLLNESKYQVDGL